MKRGLMACVWGAAILAVGVVCVVEAGAAPTSAPAGAAVAAEGGDFHRRLTEMFMEGKWDELEKAMPAAGKEPVGFLAGLTAAQKADVVYMRKSLAEGKPAWRKQVKAGKTFNFKALVWGRTLSTTFDPSAKGNVQINVTNGQASATVMWVVEDMDSEAHAEHGFSKGDLSDLGMWAIMGMADAWAVVPVQMQVNLKEAGRIQLQQYLDFRANLTGLCYSKPQGRLWGMWLYSASFMDKYKGPMANSRRAIGAMMVAEVVAKPEKYPTLKLPTDKEDWTEEKLALHFKDMIEKGRKNWSFEEDKLMREAFYKFAVANDGGAMKSGKVVMANGLAVGLDPEADKVLQEKRNAWLSTQYKGAMEKMEKKPS